MALSRKDFMQAVGESKPIDRLVNQAYLDLEQKEYESRSGNDPHGRQWSVSLHASAFPGDDDKYCPRKDAYSLMNIPSSGPFKRAGRAIMESGLVIEEMITSRLAKEGYLISAAPWEKTQTGFVDKENWITGNCDGVVAIPNQKTLHVLEIKTKFDEVIRNMMGGQQGPDIAHIKQLKTYIGFLNKQFYTDPNLARLRESYVCKESGKLIQKRYNDDLKGEYLCCPDHGFSVEKCGEKKEFLPPTSGSIYYISRDNPSKIKEFVIDIDEGHIERGIKNVNITKEHFLNGELPPRPKNWEGWSKNPCQWCEMKKHNCRPDEKSGITRLKDSHAVDFAKSVNPSYDVDVAINSVKDFWEKNGQE